MEVIERLTLEAARADTVLASEHRQRYEFAARLCSGERVLDLCCGSGYGAAILAASASEVVGVDNDAATVEAAQASVGREVTNASFELADAVDFLGHQLHERFDVVVCFEGLEHLHDLERVMSLLREHAEQGLRLITSVPNSKMYRETNPFHLTDFGYDEALAAFAPFPEAVMLPQYLAEGSLICPPEAHETEVTLALDGRDEPEYANHFIFCIGFESAALQAVHHGSVQLNTSPIFNRWSEGLKIAVDTLRRENARLARARLGKAGSAAATALATLAEREARIVALEQRSRFAEARVRELELALKRAGRNGAVGDRATVPSREPIAVAPEGGQVAARQGSGEDPNSWENRRRRAAEFLIPWIEQTVPLAGQTVLEYGCGNAAVSCAFAERAGRLIGLDIDADWIESGREEARRRGLDNVELELHPVDDILGAAAGRRGEVDVFLCYAVLEHLTIAERLALLRVAREVVKPDGAIVVCEAPNRLIYSDFHTSQLPFFSQLPDELAVDYSPRSAREDFRSAIESAARTGREAAIEALVRWGRGVSFHEFELVFDDLSKHVIASNYDPVLLPERPVHPEEMMLARYLEQWRPDLAPVFSRFWLDLILSPRPVDKRPSFLRPWTVQTVESRDVSWSGSETVELRGPDSTLWATLPHPTSRMVVGVLSAPRAIELRLRGETMDAPLSAAIDVRHPSAQAFASFDLPQPQQRVALSASEPCSVVFVGYED